MTFLHILGWVLICLVVFGWNLAAWFNGKTKVKIAAITITVIVLLGAYLVSLNNNADIRTCAFSQGAMAIAKYTVNLDGTRVSMWEPLEGDKKACERVGETLP